MLLELNLNIFKTSNMLGKKSGLLTNKQPDPSSWIELSTKTMFPPVA